MATRPSKDAGGTRQHARTPLPRGFWSLWSVVALDLLGFGIVLPILPLYTEDLGASPIAVGAVLSAYSVAQLIGAPILGRISDRVGRRRVIIVSLIGSAVGFLITGLAGSVWVIFAARALDGFSGGSLGVAQAAVADIAPPPERPRLFGLLGAAVAVGFVAGPVLGSLAAVGGVRLPFYIAAGLCGINAVTAWWRLPDTVGQPGALAEDVRRPVGVAGIGALIRSMRAGGQLGLLLAVAFLASAAFSGFEATFSLLGRRRVGLSPAGAGVVFTAVGILLGVVQGLLVKRVVARRGPIGTLQIAFAVLAAGFVALIPSGGWPPLIVGIGLLTVGQALVSPSLSAAVAEVAPPDQRGLIFGYQQASSAAARVVGPLVALGLFGLGTGLPYVASLLLVGLAFFLATSASSRTEEPDPVQA